MAELTENISEGIPNTTDYYYYADDEEIETNWCDMKDIWKLSALLTSILYSVIFFFSLLGNNLVLWIVLKYENLMSLTNLFIVNLCISDIAFSCTLPFWIVYHNYGWILGDFLCKTMSAIFSISYYSGVIFLTIMTIFRYLAVSDPLSTLKTQTKRSGILISLTIWITSFLFVIPEITYIQVTTATDNSSQLICDYQAPSPWKLVELCEQVILFLISFIIIATFYVSILKILLSSRSQRRHRTVKLIFTIVVVFFLSWAPYNVLGFVYVLSTKKIIKLHCEVAKKVFVAFDIGRKVAYCHCCLNPVLYVFVGVKFRRHLKLLYSQFAPCHKGIPQNNPRFHSFSLGPYEEPSLY